MDRALLLLIGLRFRGWLRRLAHTLRTPKGLALSLAGVAVFLPAFAGVFLDPRGDATEAVEGIRRVGPWLLLAYLLINLLTSNPSEQAISFSPAEVNFLFPGPFTSRQLLAYKLATAIGTVTVLTPFLGTFLRRFASSWGSGLSGLWLTLVFLQLTSTAIGLAGNALGAFAADRRRRLVLAGLAGLAVAAVAPLGLEALRLSPPDLLDRVETSPAARVAVAPFRPFIEALTARRIWPDLVGWSALALAIDGAMLGLVFGLNAAFLEAAASASARTYARIERVRRGGATITLPGAKARRSLPMLPAWGGVGPVAWRQLTAAARDFGRLLILPVALGAPIAVGLFSGGRSADPSRAVTLLAFLTLAMGPYLSMFLIFDFRGDLDRMEALKTWPIPSWRLALGQVAAPALIITAWQWLALAALAARRGGPACLILGAAALTIPLNMLSVGFENLWILWFPAKFVPSGTMDVQLMGRMMVMMFGKLVLFGLVAGVSALVGVAAAWLIGRGAGLPAGLVTAGAAALAMDGLLIPLIAHAFDRFDVARDTPPA